MLPIHSIPALGLPKRRGCVVHLKVSHGCLYLVSLCWNDSNPKGAEMRRVVHVNDGERHEFDWGSITWLQSGSFSQSAELAFGEVVIRSGRSNPMHIHTNCEEVLYLLEGDLEHTCGDESPYQLRPGSSICIPRGVPHNAACTSDCDARMVVAYSSAYREMRGE